MKYISIIIMIAISALNVGCNKPSDGYSAEILVQKNGIEFNCSYLSPEQASQDKQFQSQIISEKFSQYAKSVCRNSTFSSTDVSIENYSNKVLIDIKAHTECKNPSQFLAGEPDANDLCATFIEFSRR